MTTETKQAEQEETIPLTQLTVIIDRGADIKLPTTIFEYELPVLQAIYGEEQVFVAEEEDVEVPTFTANEAHDALRRKYSQEQSLQAVLSVYPRPATLAKASGLEVDEDAGKGKLQQSAVTDHKKAAAKKTAAKKTAPAK